MKKRKWLCAMRRSVRPLLGVNRNESGSPAADSPPVYWLPEECVNQTEFIMVIGRGGNAKKNCDALRGNDALTPA